MSGANRFGNLFQVTTFGESHGVALGCVIDGCPAGVPLTREEIQRALDRRRPGQAAWVSARNESDQVEILSGLHRGKTLGTPIAAIVRNQDARSEDYAPIEEALAEGRTPRVGHADDLWREKFGHSDVRGGGRSSGRETLARVIAGEVAKKVVLKSLESTGQEARVIGFAQEIAGIAIDQAERANVIATGRAVAADACFPADAFVARLPSEAKSREVERKLVDAVKEGRSYGGVAEIVVLGLPKALGQPVFHKLKADLAAAYMGVGAAIGVEIGSGFSAAGSEGTEFHRGDVGDYGGIRGGLSTGEPLTARIVFKPTSTVMDLAKRGRHDPCIVPRALPVLEAMTWLVLCDHLLWRRLDR